MLIILRSHINKQKLYPQQLTMETYFNLVSKIIVKFIFTKYFFVLKKSHDKQFSDSLLVFMVL